MKKNVLLLILALPVLVHSQTPRLLGEGGKRTDINSLTFLENRNALVSFSTHLRKLSQDSIPNVGIASYGNSISGPYAVSFTDILRNYYDFRLLTYPSSYNAGIADFTFNGIARYSDSAIYNQNNLDGNPGANFSIVSSGDHFVLASNDSLTGSTGQGSGYDMLKIIFAKAPTGGSVTVKLWDLLADTILGTQSINLYSDTIAPAKIEFANLQDWMRLRFSIVCTSGEAIGVKVAFMYSKGITPLQLGRGGSTLAQNMHANSAIMKFLLDEFNIKLLIVSAKEENATVSLPALADTLKKYPLISKLIIGSTPDAGSVATQLSNNKLFREMALQNGFAYCDAYSLFGNYANLSALGLQGDGTHPRGIANDVVIRELFAAMGWATYSNKFKMNIDNTDLINSRYIKTPSLYILTHGPRSSEDRKRLFATSSGGGAPMKINLFNLNRIHFDSSTSSVGLAAYGTQGVAVLDNKLMRAGRFVVSDDAMTSAFGVVAITRGLVVNQGNGENNMYVRGTTDNQLIFTHASLNRVGIGTQFPTEKLTINCNMTSLAPAYTTGGYQRLVRNTTSGRYEELPETITASTITTTNSTPANFIIPTVIAEVGVLEVTITGKEQGTSNGGITGKKIIRYKNLSGSVSLGTATAVLADEEDMTGTPTWTITTSGTNIHVRVTGVDATNIIWNMQYQLTRSVNPTP